MLKQEVRLWPQRAPFASGPQASDEPCLQVYLPDPLVSTGFGMLAFAGDSHAPWLDASAQTFGEWFATRGVAVIVVQARRGHDALATCADAYAALALVRANASGWGLGQHQIGVMGSSTGALLAGILCTGAGQSLLRAHGVNEVVDLSVRPSFGVFCYGMLTLNDPLVPGQGRASFLGHGQDDVTLQQAFSPLEAVDATCPRAFIWHTLDDGVVPAENAKRFAARLLKAGVPHELHLYQKGMHGLGLARAERLYWANDCLRWITL